MAWKKQKPGKERSREKKLSWRKGKKPRHRLHGLAKSPSKKRDVPPHERKARVGERLRGGGLALGKAWQEGLGLKDGIFLSDHWKVTKVVILSTESLRNAAEESGMVVFLDRQETGRSTSGDTDHCQIF